MELLVKYGASIQAITEVCRTPECNSEQYKLVGWGVGEEPKRWRAAQKLRSIICLTSPLFFATLPVWSPVWPPSTWQLSWVIWTSSCCCCRMEPLLMSAILWVRGRGDNKDFSCCYACVDSALCRVSSVEKQRCTWPPGRARSRWSGVCWGMEQLWMPGPGWDYNHSSLAIFPPVIHSHWA